MCLVTAVAAALALSCPLIAKEPNQALIILKSRSFADTEATIKSLQSEGARVGHVLSPDHLIVDMSADSEVKVKRHPNIYGIHRESVPPGLARDADDEAPISAWNSIVATTPPDAAADGSPLVGDAFERPSVQTSSMAVTAALTPTSTQTSEFMIGKIAVGVILPESNGNGENWSTARQNDVFNKIVQGMNWWVTRGGSAANLTFYYDKKFSVPTQYEPITMNGDSDENLWVSDIFQNMGYSGSDRFTRAYSYINELRNSFHTDWAFAVIVVDSLNDSDGRFSGGSLFAYAWLGGPFMVMTYDNNGWGISQMNRVASHETGHIFLAADEYCQTGYFCCNTANSGYLNIPNLNCESGNPSSVSCIMRHNEDALCQYTNGQIGWRDSDADGIPDTIDNTVNNTLNGYTSPTQNTVLTMSGSASDIPCVSPTRSDVTINTISSVKFRVDGGEWIDGYATDGAFDQYTETYAFTTPSLSAGVHTIQTQAFSSSGNGSNVASVTVDVRPDSAVVYVNGANTNPVRDGSSWTKALTTVQQGLTAATSGKEIWVASGTYRERIALKLGVAVYGGFAANEGLRSERNPAKNVTILDGNQGGNVVIVPSGATSTTVIDGFMIMNGRAANGGGIYCATSSPKISNNTITGNTATSYGGGIYCTTSSAIIANNIIKSNTAFSGGGVYCYAGAPAITNNTITSNAATNYGGAIYSSNSLARITNNVIALNTSGVYSVSASPSAANNCVFQNGAYNYIGTTSTADVLDDPLFADGDSGDYHLRRDSPCIDTGTTNADTPTSDKDGLARPQDGDGDGSVEADIGAYEFPLPLGVAKASFQDGEPVTAGGLIVTGRFPVDGIIYAERPERCSGIRIDTGETYTEGQVLNISGTMRTDSATGERYIEPSGQSPDLAGNGTAVGPLGLTTIALGGGPLGLQDGVWTWRWLTDQMGNSVWSWTEAEGLNNIGLLVRVCGAVTYIDPAGAYFYIDDGSALQDGSAPGGSPLIGVRVSFDGRSYAVGQQLAVTGISSCYKVSGAPCRLIKVRSAQDITSI